MTLIRLRPGPDPGLPLVEHPPLRVASACDAVATHRTRPRVRVDGRRREDAGT